ncbi:hypothetical protein FSP39_022097 [Pinctada imbricata]|uniref:Thioredoxin domain-containing protein n=1 Tax=Pinctada imbricata TaxID=66713 RepID=A0AA88XU10_PINIB|nr:hypothetical protein FSP39_022097 [Pinctada imbricata]
MAGIKGLVGETVLGKKGEVVNVDDIIKDKEAIGLYFSAHWCPPCRGFTPLLKDYYKTHEERLAIIFVSSDRDEASFNGYFGEMPWHAVSFNNTEVKGKLSSKYEIRGIPTLLFLDSNGEMLRKDGRAFVTNKEDPSKLKEKLAQATE